MSMSDSKHNSDLSLDLSSKNLYKWPLIEMNLIRHLYLEDNKLFELPENLFTDAPNLQWLDVRNNNICKFPLSIENHESIEIILFQNNKLSFLPLVLGTAKNLKSIQLTGNPITWPSKSIIKSGTTNVIKYLLFQYNKDLNNREKKFDNCIDLSLQCDDLVDNTTTLNDKQRKINSKVSFLENKTHLSFKSLSDVSLDSECNTKNEITKLKPTVSTRSCVSLNVELPETKGSRYKSALYSKYSNSSKYVKRAKTRNKDEQTVKIQETLMKEVWLEKRKELLSKRERVLQDRRSLEALKHWRNDYKETSGSNTNIYYALNLSKLPYDTDIEFVKILTRADIEKDLPDKYKRNIRNKCKIGIRKPMIKPNIEMKIAEVVDSLEFTGSDCVEWSPRTQKSKISEEMKKLKEIKKKIVNLKIDNNNYF